MDNSWIKLYRKILNRDDFFRARYRFEIFCFLLLIADRNGEKKIARDTISRWLKIKQSTVYKTLKWLQKGNEIVMNSNNKGTTIKIVNWSKYQSKPTNLSTPNVSESNNKVTTKEQQSNTIQEYKNKEYKNNDKSLGKPFGNQDINHLTEYLKEKLGLSILDDSEQTNRRYCWLCIKKFGLDKTRLAIDATARSQFWHTKITSFKGLYYNAVKIVSSGRGEVRSIDAKKVLGSKDAGRERISANGGGVQFIKGDIASGT